MKTANDLLKLALEQEQIAEDLDARIGGAALAGDDLDDLTHQKQAALSKAKAYRDAVRAAEEIESERLLEAQRRARSKALGVAADQVEEVLDLAEEVDAAIIALEQHYEALSLKLLELQRSLRLADNSDNGRLASGMKPALRWAMAHGAPNLSDDAGIPRVTNARRKGIQESLNNLIPHLPEQEAA
ncbi:MAG: hypothetical protein AAF264_06495 [Pseudomonadota bacterium]